MKPIFIILALFIYGQGFAQHTYWTDQLKRSGNIIRPSVNTSRWSLPAQQFGSGLTPPTQQEIIQRHMAIHEPYNKKKRKELEQRHEGNQNYEPDFAYNHSPLETKHYAKAFALLDSMAKGFVPFSLKRAVFAVENAYHNDTLRFRDFDYQVREMALAVSLYMQKEGLNPTDNTAKNMVNFRLFTEGIEIKNPKTKKLIKTQPFMYDFIDYKGKQDWKQQFVTKLMATHRGNCHSLPLLYLIVAEQLGAKAWLSTSPNHYYVKIKDDRGRLQNIELTNPHFSTDAFMMSSGFITSESLRNNLFMDTLTSTQVLAEMFNDLGNGYLRKFGYEPFVKQCYLSALALRPNCINATLGLSNYDTGLLKSMLYTHQVPLDSNTLRQNPEINYQFLKVNRIYNRIDELGYKQMPSEDYQSWLASMKEQENQQKSEQIKQLMLKKAQLNAVNVNR